HVLQVVRGPAVVEAAAQGGHRRERCGEPAAGLAGFRGGGWPAARLHLVGSNVGRSSGPIHYRDIEAWTLGDGRATGATGPDTA
ncbi:hypothetical protein ACWD3D_35800, partial [Streptomyces sp. NPDC002690]